MKHRGWLTILLLIALLMLLGGVRTPDKRPGRRDDPVRLGAEALAAIPGRGSAAERNAAARQNPLWILQINAEPQAQAR